MMSALTLILFGLSLPAAAQADEPLQEGFTAHLASGTQRRHRVLASADLNLLPLPGGGRLNGTHISVGVGTSTSFDDVDLDRGLVQLLRWPHLRLGGVMRNRDEGIPLGVEFGGVSLPLALAGKKEARSWIISLLGVDAGLHWYRTGFNAREDGMAFKLTPSFRIDEQVDLLDRLMLRAWQKAAYSPLFGRFGGEDAPGFRHQLRLSGELGLYLDITPKPLYRQIPRTDPATGLTTTRRSVNQGLRWRWMIIKASGEWQPVGYVSGESQIFGLSTGFERRF